MTYKGEMEGEKECVRERESVCVISVFARTTHDYNTRSAYLIT